MSHLAWIERSVVTQTVTEELTLLHSDVDVGKDTGEEHPQEDGGGLAHNHLVESGHTQTPCTLSCDLLPLTLCVYVVFYFFYFLFVKGRPQLQL